MTEIQLHTSKKLNIGLGLSAVLCAAAIAALYFCAVADSSGVLISLGCAAAFFLLALLSPRLMPLGALPLAALLSYMAIALLTWGSFTWASDTSPLLHLFGALWVLAVYFLLFAIFGRVTPAVVAGLLLSLIFGIANAVMTQFRDRLLLAGDLAALRTAINVAGNFSLKLSVGFLLGLGLLVLALVCCVLLSLHAGREESRPWRIGSRAAAAALCLLWLLISAYGNIYEQATIRITWNENDFEESPVLNFMKSVDLLRVEKPEGYSDNSLEEIAAGITNPTAEAEQKPHIIAIMDEAFSDLSVISEFATSEEIMPFFNSLTENTVRGHVYTSVRGGGTANSEYELLTGNTMAFFSNGVYPYQQYIRYEKDGLVSQLESQGYSSMVIHPYDASGWNRVEVYDCLGFDETHFIEDFQSKRYLRGYVSDESDFENLIRWYEEGSGDGPLFLFNITMQNHGGYTNASYEPTVSITGHEGEFPLAEQYLSLVRETDRALEGLIEYFSAVDEPVILLFFGDHQPIVDEGFYELLYGKTPSELSLEELQREFATPFVIWANYDIEECEGIKTSANFLGPLLLETAGLPMSDFFAFLSELRGQWPAVNARGFLNADGSFYAAEDEIVAGSASLSAYRQLQYNYLFDTRAYLAPVFALS